MRRGTTVSWAAGVAAALLLGGCGGGRSEGEPASPEPIRARIAVAERTEILEAIVLRGRVEAASVAVVSTRVMATVTAVHVSAGDRVETGDLLIEIDPQASGGQLAQARGGLAQAAAARAMAEKSFHRFESLASRDAASELELDQARTQLELANAAVDQARGAVAAASSMAGDARVTAPFAGRVAGRMVEPGDLAAPGRPLVRVESDGARRFVVPVPASTQSRARLAVDDPVWVTLDTRPELGRLQGTVVEVAPGADPSSQAFDVEISLPVADLATGISGRAWLETDPRPAVLVPAAAILEQGGLELVVLRREDGRTTTRVVKTGSEPEPGRVEVLSGLRGGEIVLVGLGSVPPAGSPVEEARP
jgi:RND family efflux transporter MFP subunit